MADWWTPLTMLDRAFATLVQLSWAEVATAGLFALGLVAYYLLVYHFYHFLCRRDTFHSSIMHYDPGFVGIIEMIVHAGMKFFKYGVLFPIVSFLWFLGFTILLFVASGDGKVQDIALIAIGIISASRILAYYKEEISTEFTQQLPIFVLVVILVESARLNVASIAERISLLPTLGPVVFQYVIFLSLLEMTLRTLFVLKRKVIGHPHKVLGLAHDVDEEDKDPTPARAVHVKGDSDPRWSAK